MSAAKAIAEAAGGGDQRRRAMCVWLAALASYRQGLVGRLLKAYGEPEALIDTTPSALRALLAQTTRGRAAVGAAAQPIDDSSGAESVAFARVLEQAPAACLAAALRGDGVVATWCDDLYPAMLRHLADPPLCLFVRTGSDSATTARRLESLGRQPVVAVVGTRTPSPYGEEMAALLGRELTARGALVVSGLAMGVDALAQEAALRAGSRLPEVAATVGVLGCGPDIVYPAVNRRLFEAVAQRGLLVSEFLWGVRARAWRFPARNRVMAALAHAVVIVEGTSRSGARLTADYALDLGREVLAVPGEAGRRLSQAPHALLRQGAGLCESADDVLAAIAGVAPVPPSITVATAGTASPRPVSAGPAGDRHPTRVLEILDRGPSTADQIAAGCTLTAAETNAALAQLELAGFVRRQDGGVYRRRR